jgi:3-hydroxyacyl-CoA dehydrogenase
MTQPASIDHVGVVGAGFMGSGIAESVARAGLRVTLFEPEAATLDRSHEICRGRACVRIPGRPECPVWWSDRLPG